jgi:hypothetical protein
MLVSRGCQPQPPDRPPSSAEIVVIKKLITLFLLLAFSVPVQAQTAGWKEGGLKKLWPDPSDIVVEPESACHCGSIFPLQRLATDFDQMTALMLSAATGGRMVNMLVTGCNGDRNTVIHGVAYF